MGGRPPRGLRSVKSSDCGCIHHSSRLALPGSRRERDGAGRGAPEQRSPRALSCRCTAHWKVPVSWGCLNRWPQPGAGDTTEMRSHAVLEAGVQTAGGGARPPHLGGPRRGSSLLPPASGGPGCPGACGRSCSFRLRGCTASPLCVYHEDARRCSRAWMAPRASP